MLNKYSSLPDTPLQIMEDCEQLKILENGYKIKSYPTIEYNEISLNTEEDYKYFQTLYNTGSLKMINIDSISIFPFSYPILISKKIIDENIYIQLKQKWPKFKDFNTNSNNQVSRLNLELTKDNSNYNKIDDLFKKLYDEFNSKTFRNFLETTFDLKNKDKNGFIGNIESSVLKMHIAESRDGYENPWHVDTRGRIIHFLIYFGDETIKEGGELGIATHKELDSFLDYKQYPNKDNLTKIVYFRPENNLGVFILSQNNSYHKGCATKGLRRFIYFGYTNREYAWKTNNWACNMDFASALKNI